LKLWDIPLGIPTLEEGIPDLIIDGETGFLIP